MPVHAVHGYCEECGCHTCLYMIIDPPDTAWFLCRDWVSAKAHQADGPGVASIPEPDP